MKPKPPVLEELRRRFERTRNRKTDCFVPYEELLTAAGAADGEERERAEKALEVAAAAGWLRLETERYTLKRERVRLVLDRHEELYLALDEEPPAARQQRVAALFSRQPDPESVPAWVVESWQQWLAEAAANPEGTRLTRHPEEEIERILKELRLLLQRVDAEAEEPIREVSASLCDDSKRLERKRGEYQRLLREVSRGEISGYEDLGIGSGFPTATLWGRWTLALPGGRVELAAFADPVRISAADLESAKVELPADLPVVTVENRTSLLTWARLSEPVLLLSSGEEGGFAHSAVISLLKRLPFETRLFHWGDSDPHGFGILASLRERSGREIAGLGMDFVPAEAAIPLTLRDEAEIERLLVSDFLQEEEKGQLRVMRSCGSKGAFEQERQSRPPRLPA